MPQQAPQTPSTTCVHLSPAAASPARQPSSSWQSRRGSEQGGKPPYSVSRSSMRFMCAKSSSPGLSIWEAWGDFCGHRCGKQRTRLALCQLSDSRRACDSDDCRTGADGCWIAELNALHAPWSPFRSPASAPAARPAAYAARRSRAAARPRTRQQWRGRCGAVLHPSGQQPAGAGARQAAAARPRRSRRVAGGPPARQP